MTRRSSSAFDGMTTECNDLAVKGPRSPSQEQDDHDDDEDEKKGSTVDEHQYPRTPSDRNAARTAASGRISSMNGVMASEPFPNVP